MFTISPETSADIPAIDALLDDGFGGRRLKKTVYRLRAAAEPEAELSLVALDTEGGDLVGTLRFWPVQVGGAPALLLGPLASSAEKRGQGIGKALVAAALARIDAGCGRPVLLIGPLSFYKPFGFEPVEPGTISLPGPYDPARLLLRPGRQRAPLAGLILAGSMAAPASPVAGQAAQAIAS